MHVENGTYSRVTSHRQREKKRRLNEGEDRALANELSWMDIPDKTFDYANLCVFCDQPLDATHKLVRTIDCNAQQISISDWSILSSDETAKEVYRRIKHVKEGNISGMYHSACRKRPSWYTQQATDSNEAFEIVSNYIESSGEYKFELAKLRELIKDCDDGLSDYKLNKKLEEKFGNDILIIRQIGKPTVYFYKTNDLFDKSKEWLVNPQSLSDFEKSILLKISADIIRHDIFEKQYEVSEYPPAKHFLDTVKTDIPEALKTFLNYLFENIKDKAKLVERDSIAHSIISILRQRNFISKLQLSVGTYILRKTGSRLIINLLCKLGVSGSYHNIQLHEASTIINPPKSIKEKVFVQFSFDNTDHNVSTLTGHETFHCLGGIAMYTPQHAISYQGGSKKCSRMPRADQLAGSETIPIVPFISADPKKLENIVFVDTDKLPFERDPEKIPKSYVAYLLAKANNILDTPLWKGYMEYIHSDASYSMSHIQCLPFVNGQPHDLSVLHSALLYALQKADECDQYFVFATFDLPLYMKTRCLVEQSDNSQIVSRVIVRLGGFHLLSSYIKAIGHIMEDSGLEDLWTTVYAGDSVKKLMTGQAFSRSVRAHILTFTALGIIICENIGGVSQSIKDYMQRFIGKWDSNDSIKAGDIRVNAFITEATNKFIKELQSLEQKGATPKLWTQYMIMVITMLRFIESERLGLWQLNLQSMENMLLCLHAAGHWAYVKALQIFLQDMANLRNKMKDHVEEYLLYTEGGFFTIRRSDKAFGGIWSDMTIEQTLNRFFGTDLKHGRGVTPSVVARYLFGMPSAFQVMENLEEYLDLMSANSEQHVDTTSSRMKVDDDHVEKFVFLFKHHNPFTERTGLTSLSTGIIGDASINCHLAYEKGREGMKSMHNKNLSNVSLSAAKFKVNTFASARKGIHIYNEKHVVDSNLLFLRISVFFHGDEHKTRDALKYELSPYPPCLFDEQGFLRKNNKSDLYKIFKPPDHTDLQLKNFCNVVDGGWLLHRVVWPHSQTFEQIFEIYYKYVAKLGLDTKIIFDGYSSESIHCVKSYERYRRKEKNVPPDFEIRNDALITMTQKKFFTNVANKHKFVQLLADYLNSKGIEVIIAKDDADVPIIQKALDVDKQVQKSVAVVGNDVDLLVLLLAHAPETSNIFFYKIPPGKKDTQLFCTADNIVYKPFIFFAHAFSGCDSTSALYNQGKKSITTLLRKNGELQDLIGSFSESNQNIDTLYPIAEKIIKYLYGGNSSDISSIADLRYKNYKISVASGGKESILSYLPPTESALKMYTRRVYYQVQQWLQNEHINPVDWGWISTNVMLIPKMMEDGTASAPDSLLKNVFCGCTGDCSTSRCSCRKSGLQCSHFCKNCNGESCINHADIIIFADDDYDDYDGREISEDVNEDSNVENVDDTI